MDRTRSGQSKVLSIQDSAANVRIFGAFSFPVGVAWGLGICEDSVFEHSAGILEQSMGAKSRVGSCRTGPPAYLAWRADTTYGNHIPTRFLAPVDCSKIPAQTSIVS